MTAYQKLYTGIGRAAWGYFFIYFDFNINTVSILPSFIGYMLFLSAINCLCEEERELNLLRTLGVILTVWHVASWLASWGSIDLDGMLQVVDIIIGVVNIYFHFQLLTNLASIATKYQSADDELDAKLLRYRTLQTVMLTAVIIVGYDRLTLDYLVCTFLFLKRGRDYQYSHFFGYSFRASIFISAKHLIRNRYSIFDLCHQYPPFSVV